jgi:hypothetical protein
MAELLHRLGYLQKGHLVHAMRDDLVGEYIGQTAPRDYGQEAIDILLQVMENERGNLVVILAGYKDRMEEFFGSNPGMGSRIAHHLDFAAYELDELVAIGRMGQPHFAIARSVRNELDLARLRHAHRLVGDLDRSWNRDELMRLEPADVVPCLAADQTVTPSGVLDFRD